MESLFNLWSIWIQKVINLKVPNLLWSDVKFIYYCFHFGVFIVYCDIKCKCWWCWSTLQVHNFILFLIIIFIWNTFYPKVNCENFSLLFCSGFRSCVKQCEETGCFKDRCFPNCKFSSDEVTIHHPWGMLEPLYVHWKKGDCQNDCQYYCMFDREKERELLNKGPEKYHSKWPFKRTYGIQVCY